MVARDLFWFAAGSFATLALALVALPLLRGNAESRTGRPLWIVGMVALLVLGGTFGLYRTQGSPDSLGGGLRDSRVVSEPRSPATDSIAGTGAPSMADATARLAARLAAEGGTAAEWTLLAKSYEFLGRTDDAADAAAKAASAGASTAAAPAGVARIEGSVDITPVLRARIGTKATLYIFATGTAAGGPPLAVIRKVASQWPVKFVLDDSNAMVASSRLSTASSVQLEARVSQTGNAIAAPGDLSGTISALDPRLGKPVHILIDNVL